MTRNDPVPTAKLVPTVYQKGKLVIRLFLPEDEAPKTSLAVHGEKSALQRFVSEFLKRQEGK